MENPQRKTDDGQKLSSLVSQIFFNNDGHFVSRYKIFGEGGNGSNRLILLCLGLLNVVLLIVAVVLGINCARVKEGSFQVSHSAIQIINDLNNLRSNHSDVIKAEEEAKNALERAIKNHTQLKVQIEQQKAKNNDYQRKFESLQTEKENLQTNISALEGTCGRCLSKWVLHNSSCYFFSYTVFADTKKNWAESRTDCTHRGADLLVIDNPEEQKFINTKIEHKRITSMEWKNGFWIGLTDTETEGTWVWINNVTEVEQRYWMDGEPNGNEGENCGIVTASSSNPWKTRWDANCDKHLLRWICEMPST